MKRTNLTIEKIKDEIEKLKGQYVSMKVNQGRKKYINLKGTIEDTFNSIFIVRIDNPSSVDLKSYTYIDILCGNVNIANTPLGTSKKTEDLKSLLLTIDKS